MRIKSSRYKSKLLEAQNWISDTIAIWVVLIVVVLVLVSTSFKAESGTIHSIFQKRSGGFGQRK